MIHIDKINDGLPVSVIIPLSENRKDFFYNFTLPLIEANNVNEIIIIDDDNNAPYKRNIGYDKSTEEFIFFCDDDILLPKDHISKLLKSLNDNVNASYAYSSYEGIVLNPNIHPIGGNFKLNSIEFNPTTLKKYNYISTMSLIKRNDFIKFDESLKRFQDWDLWLTLLSMNRYGVYVNNTKFYAYYLDNGITNISNNENLAYNIIKLKHNL